jgi:LPS O-antigen subunit length determinant protein (WzzB/FepE family)
MNQPVQNQNAPLPPQYPFAADDEIDLKELFMVLWAGKWLVMGVTAIAAIVSVVVALMLPNIYTSSALLAPAESASGGMSSLMKQYGGLASLAGVSLPGGGDGSKAGLAKELMKSRAFLAEFVQRRDILPDLMATKAWDASANAIEYDAELYDVKGKVWVRDVDPPKQAEPSMQEAYKAFTDILSVSEDKETAFVTVSIEHQSPYVAQQWVSWLVDDINQAVKDQDVAEAKRSIEYLKEQVSNTSLAELQTMFFELIQSQTETIMLAEVRPEYVFKTIDPAVVPEEKSKPKRALICVLGTMLGGMLGVLIVLVRHYAFGKSEPA